MPTSESAIVIRDVSKRFGETVALDNCSVTIRPGEIHAIVGENGSGKSTLAKILSGVLTPDSGTLSVFGERPLSPIHARRLGIATIFQEVLVAEDLSVLDNLFAGSDRPWRREHTPQKARMLGRALLERLTASAIDLNARVASLSLSMKQWIVIARALLSEPKLLILDESSAALDLEATARLHAEIDQLRHAGCYVVMVTHRIAELTRITDRATVLRDGQVAGELSGSEITERNLLALMSPDRHILDTRARRMAEGAREPEGSVLSARELQTAAGGRPFDFRLGKGEIVGVTGLDGQGHDRFVRTIAGVLPAVHGRVLVHRQGLEESIRNSADAARGGIAFISGDRAREGIFPNLSILENFAVALYRSRCGALGWVDRDVMLKCFEPEVKRLQIRTGAWSDRITSLSGGNQQKVLIARAFAQSPSIIVLDDPARGVDASTKRELYAELRDFAKSGGAVVYLSSEIEEFFDFADRVVVFRAGEIFDTITAQNMSEQGILAAMFGQSKQESPAYEAAEHC